MITAEIKKCNNIDEATIETKKNHLNICYAMNGTGKSTIAKAIKYKSDNKELSELKTFGSDAEPTCSLSESVKALLFNEEYVDKYVFQESEVIPNSFEVFIKSPQYEEQQKIINQKLKDIHIDINQNPDLLQLVNIGNAVLSRFFKTTSR